MVGSEGLRSLRSAGVGLPERGWGHFAHHSAERFLHAADVSPEHPSERDPRELRLLSTVRAIHTSLPHLTWLPVKFNAFASLRRGKGIVN